MKEREAVVAEEYFTLRSIGDVTQCGDLGLVPGFTMVHWDGGQISKNHKSVLTRA